MAEQLELKLDFEQSKEAKQIKANIETTRNLINSAEEIHQMVMDNLRARMSVLRKEFQEKCIHPSTKIRNDYNYHKNEDWQEEVCNECGVIIRRW